MRSETTKKLLSETPDQVSEEVRETYNKIMQDNTKAENRWISVKDKLPEFDRRVLLYHDVKTEWKENNYGTIIGYLNQIVSSKSSTWLDFLSEETRTSVKATHWMPLPEPPKN